MNKLVIRNVEMINEAQKSVVDVLVEGERITKIGSGFEITQNHLEISGEGMHLFPGVIDDQVHFREPGLTYKGDIYTESRAAVVGGITSFMEMPNVNPQTLTQELLAAKYDIGSRNSPANYSFYMGASNDNLDEVLKTNIYDVCGIKIFMGSSTGNMLVDNESTLEQIFNKAPMLIATHCEDESTIRANLERAMEKYGENIPFEQHPVIRSEEACYLSSSKAVSLAKKHNTRLHILHISTGKETGLFDNSIPLKDKRITSEACIHHLWFSDKDYPEKKQWIKWNPAIKTEKDRDEILKAVLDDRIDVIATDHAPHTIEEKENGYLKAPSGGPLVQHSLVAMLELYHQGKITLEKIADKMSHKVAECFQVKDRGYIREGYFADLVLVDLNDPWQVSKENLLYKCGWSPFEDLTFRSRIKSTIVSGHLAYHEGKLNDSQTGKRLTFNR